MKMCELLNRETWTQGVYARDADGKQVSVNSTMAVKFCLIGALVRCYPDDRTDLYEQLYGRLGNRELTLTGWNDYPDRKWEDVERIIKDL